MRNIIDCARAAFVADVGTGGDVKPLGSGLLRVHDDTHLVFTTQDLGAAVTRLTAGGRLELAVVDSVRRRGYRFAGSAELHEPGSEVCNWLDAQLCDCDVRPHSVSAALRVSVDYAQPVWSPAFSNRRRVDEYGLFSRLSAVYFDDLQRDPSERVAIG
jgi:hypothetical protein